MSVNVVFAACQKRIFVTIPIIDDVVVENHESFYVKLVRTPDLDSRIMIDQNVTCGEVIINDNDGMFHRVLIPTDKLT